MSVRALQRASRRAISQNNEFESSAPFGDSALGLRGQGITLGAIKLATAPRLTRGWQAAVDGGCSKRVPLIRGAYPHAMTREDIAVMQSTWPSRPRAMDRFEICEIQGATGISFTNSFRDYLQAHRRFGGDARGVCALHWKLRRRCVPLAS